MGLTARRPPEGGRRVGGSRHRSRLAEARWPAGSRGARKRVGNRRGSRVPGVGRPPEGRKRRPRGQRGRTTASTRRCRGARGPRRGHEATSAGAAGCREVTPTASGGLSRRPKQTRNRPHSGPRPVTGTAGGSWRRGAVATAAAEAREDAGLDHRHGWTRCVAACERCRPEGWPREHAGHPEVPSTAARRHANAPAVWRCSVERPQVEGTRTCPFPTGVLSTGPPKEPAPEPEGPGEPERHPKATDGAS